MNYVKTFLFVLSFAAATPLSAKNFADMTMSEKTAYVTACARGVSTIAAHATQHVGVQCVNDSVRIADSCVGILSQDSLWHAATLYRLAEMMVSGVSFYGHMEAYKKDASQQEALLPERPKHFKAISLLCGLATGVLEGWLATRVVQAQIGKGPLSFRDNEQILLYENSKLTLLRILENMMINSPLYQTMTEESKGKMFAWGGLLAVNVDRVLNHGVEVDRIMDLSQKAMQKK